MVPENPDDFLLREKEQNMVMFLHSKGYTYFTMNALTLAEINQLVDANNMIEKRKEELAESKTRPMRS